MFNEELKVSPRPKHLSMLMECSTISLMTVLCLQPGALYTNSDLDVQLFSRCTNSTNICRAFIICQAVFEIALFHRNRM